MRAAVYYGKRDLRVEERPDPVPGPGELLLEVHAVGVCGTDAAEWQHGPSIFAVPGPHSVTGHAGPMIPGHELSGRIVAVGEGVIGFDEGMLVACGAGYVSGPSESATRDRPNLGASYATVGLQRHGGLAQYVAVPADSCLDVGPYGLSDDSAALAQPMAIAVHAFRRGKPRPGESALIIGAGGIGAFIAYAASRFGLHVAVADLSSDRLAIASALGASVVIGQDEVADLAQATRSRGLDITLIYEVTGTDAGLSSALAVAERLGARVVLVGLHEQPREVDLRRVTLREIELIGTNAHVCGTDLPEAVRLLAQRTRTVGWSDIAPHAFPLEAVVEEGIVPIVERRSTRVKTLIDPWATAPRPTITTDGHRGARTPC
jgi:(R,R)-butanediol dehydrogenase/meso-butanediol dehydrogenase/diacetyl reductase